MKKEGIGFAKTDGYGLGKSNEGYGLGTKEDSSLK